MASWREYFRLIPGDVFFNHWVAAYRRKIYIEMQIKIKTASAGNRTRAARVAGEHSTTEPPMLICTICLTCTYKDKMTRVTWCMIDERQFQIGGSCTYHTTTTIDMINISLAENANYIALLKCRLSISKIAYAIADSWSWSCWQWCCDLYKMHVILTKEPSTVVMCRPDNNSSSAVVTFYRPGPSVQGVDASIHWTIFELPLTF